MTTSMLEIFRDRFRKLVDEKGISKTKCAKEIGISYKTFNDMYTYGKGKRIRILLRLVKYFQCVVGLSARFIRRQNNQIIKNALTSLLERFSLGIMDCISSTHVWSAKRQKNTPLRVPLEARGE